MVDATTPHVGFPQLADEGEKECAPEGEERSGRDASDAGSAPGGEDISAIIFLCLYTHSRWGDCSARVCAVVLTCSCHRCGGGW